MQILTNFGVVVLEDGSDVPQLYCDELYGAKEDPDGFLPISGGFLLGDAHGLFRITEGGCADEEVKPLNQRWFIRAIAQTADGTIHLVTSSGGEANDVFSSEDGGLTWTAQGVNDDGHFFTGLRALDAGPVDLVATGFEGATGALRVWMRARGGGWSHMDPGGLFVADSGQPLLVDCAPSGEACLLRWASDAEARLWRWTPEGTLEVQEVGSEESPCCPGDADRFTNPLVDAVWAHDGALLVAYDGGLMVSPDGGNTWSAGVKGIGPTCLARTPESVILCANPYLIGGFLVGESVDGGNTWTAVIDVVGDIQPSLNCGSESMMHPVCEDVWEALVTALGVGTSDNSTPTGSSGGESGAESGASRETNSGAQSGCQSVSSGSGLSALWCFLLSVMAWRIRFRLVPVLAAGCLLAGGCGEAEAPPEEEIVPEIPHSGMIVIGEFLQESSGQEGIVLNAEFAAVESLSPPFDFRVGANEECSVRIVDPDDDLSEPTGVAVGDIMLSGEGLERDVLFQPFDFGEAQGGVAYDHDADSLCQGGDLPGGLCTSEADCPGGVCDLLTGIFADTGSVDVVIAGMEDGFPSMTLSLAVPAEYPTLDPPLGWVLESANDWEFVWESSGSDRVLVELDTFPAEDGSRVQIRCDYPDTGAGAVPAEALLLLANQAYSISVSRTSQAQFTESMASVDVVLSRRVVSFIFSP
jgi:hypothetical protein